MLLRTIKNQKCVSGLISRKFHNGAVRLSELDHLKSLLNNAANTPKQESNNDNGSFKAKRSNENSFFKGDKYNKENKFNKGSKNNREHADDKTGGAFYSKGNNSKSYNKKDKSSNDYKSNDKRERKGNKHDKYGNKKDREPYDKKKREREEKAAAERERKKALLSFLETGNDRDKDAAKRIINESIAGNSKGLVQIIKERGEVAILNVVESFQGINLSEKGVIIVGNRNIKEEDDDKYGLEVGEKLVLLKVVDRQLAIKQYGDYLSEKVVEKLKLSNSKILNKQKKKNEDNSKGEIKVVQIGWNISLNDLSGQKKFEIENHLKKGNDVDIIIDEKEYLEKDNYGPNNNSIGNEVSSEKLEMYSKRRKELNEVEKTMRNKTLNLISQILNEIEALPSSNIGEKKGFMESRTILRVKGIDCKKKQEDAKKDKKEQKRLEKQQKAEKMRLRREEKERLEREQMQELTV